MDKEQLQEILEKHKKWLNNEDGGEKANLGRGNLKNVNLILKRLKKENSRNNIVQFPMQLQEEDKEAQPVWFDGLGWLTALLAVAIGVAVLIAQLGKW